MGQCTCTGVNGKTCTWKMFPMEVDPISSGWLVQSMGRVWIQKACLQAQGRCCLPLGLVLHWWYILCRLSCIGNKFPMHVIHVGNMACWCWGLRALFTLCPCKHLSLPPRGFPRYRLPCLLLWASFFFTYHACSSLGDQPLDVSQGVIIFSSIFPSSYYGLFNPGGNHSCFHTHWH